MARTCQTYGPTMDQVFVLGRTECVTQTSFGLGRFNLNEQLIGNHPGQR